MPDLGRDVADISDSLRSAHLHLNNILLWILRSPLDKAIMRAVLEGVCKGEQHGRAQPTVLRELQGKKVVLRLVDVC